MLAIIAPKAKIGTNTPPVNLLVLANKVSVILTSNNTAKPYIKTFSCKIKENISWPVDINENEIKKLSIDFHWSFDFAYSMLSCDISPVVHMCAKEDFNRIKERELKQTVTILLKQYGMYELAISLGMDLRHSLLKKLVRQEIIGLPTDKEIQKKSKKYQKIVPFLYPFSL